MDVRNEIAALRQASNERHAAIARDIVNGDIDQVPLPEMILSRLRDVWDALIVLADRIDDATEHGHS